MLKPLQARKIKKNIDGSYQLTKNVGHYGCLTKKNCLLKSSAMARNTFNIWRLADVNLHYDSFSLQIGIFNELFKATSAFEFSSSLRYLPLQFRCGFYFFNDESWSSDNFKYF